MILRGALLALWAAWVFGAMLDVRAYNAPRDWVAAARWTMLAVVIAAPVVLFA